MVFHRHTVVCPGVCLSIALVPSSFVVRDLTTRYGGEYDEGKSIKDEGHRRKEDGQGPENKKTIVKRGIHLRTAPAEN